MPQSLANPDILMILSVLSQGKDLICKLEGENENSLELSIER